MSVQLFIEEHAPTHPPPSALAPGTRPPSADAPNFRGCLTIQNHGKKKTEQGVIPKNKQLVSRNIQLWDSLFSRGWAGWGFGIIVSVVEPDGGVDSTNEAKRVEADNVVVKPL
jgi:hypothetical protein